MKPLVSTISLAGHTYPVRVIRRGNKVLRFIGDETVEAFIERMSLLGRHDILADLARVGRATIEDSLVFDSPQQTAWAIHQNRARRN